MGAVFQKGRWRYRKLVTLLDGTKERIFGTPAINTKAAAEAAERAHIERLLNPAKAAAHAAAVQESERAAKGESDEPTINELIEQMTARYTEGSSEANYSRATILRTDIAPKFGRFRPSEITQGMLNEFRDELRKRKSKANKGEPIADQTIRNKLYALTKLISWAVEEEIIAEPERTLTVKVKPTKAVRASDDPEVIAVTEESLEKLLKHAGDQRWRVVLSLGANEGLRAGEIIGLRWTDRTTEDGADGFRIERSISPRNVEGPPKGKITRFVPLSSATIAELKKLPHRSFYLLTRLEDDPSARRNVKRASPPGGHLGYSGLHKAIKKIYKRAGVRYGKSKTLGTIHVMHSLRHTYGTRLVAGDVHPDRIQRLMGHKDYRVTQRYITITKKQLQAEVRRVIG